MGNSSTGSFDDQWIGRTPLNANDNPQTTPPKQMTTNAP